MSGSNPERGAMTAKIKAKLEARKNSPAPRPMTTARASVTPATVKMVAPGSVTAAVLADVNAGRVLTCEQVAAKLKCKIRQAQTICGKLHGTIRPGKRTMLVPQSVFDAYIVSKVTAA